MARMTDFSGLDDAVKSLTSRGELMGRTAQRMVQVGADEMAKARRAEAERRGLRKEGDMIKQIKPTRKIKSIGGQLTLDVFSQGKDERGVRNATKEFMDHYGYKSRPASHWVDSAEEKGKGPAEAAMQQVVDEDMEG
jgi:hypothetical protein